MKWTFDSLLNGKLRTSKGSTFTAVDHIDAPDDYTVIFHLKEPMASLLWNVSDGAIGIVPYGSGEDFNRNPIGSGPFRFLSAQQDKNVIIERNPDYWATPAKLQRVEFRVIPDATTRALELRKRSADVVSNGLTPDMVLALQKDDGLRDSARAGNHLCVPRLELARSHIAGRARAPCAGLLHRSRAHHSLPLA